MSPVNAPSHSIFVNKQNILHSTFYAISFLLTLTFDARNIAIILLKGRESCSNRISTVHQYCINLVNTVQISPPINSQQNCTNLVSIIDQPCINTESFLHQLLINPASTLYQPLINPSSTQHLRCNNLASTLVNIAQILYQLSSTLHKPCINH